jgi:trimethylamine--corrinoid protein Co-methyltransferase
MEIRSNHKTNLSPYFRVLGDDQIEDLHQAALEILRRTGVQVEEPVAIEILTKGGCWLEGNRVYFPPRLVEWAIEASPSRVVLCDREGQPVVVLQGDRSYFGTGSDTPNIIDPYSGERRLAVKQDVINTSKLVDALTNVSFMMCSGIASDVPEQISDIHHFEAMVRNTAKPIVFTAWSLENLKVILEMAELIVGGEQNLQRKPLCALYAEPTSPLTYAEETTQKIMYMAEKGLPTAFSPGPIQGATGPVTIAGSIALANAELLAGLVLVQLIREGTPFVAGGGVTTMDMRTTMVSYCSPEFMLGLCGSKDLARHFRMPMFHFAGCSDSKTFDQQAAMEGALWILLASLNGGNLVHDLGYLESGLTTSYEMLVVMDEVVGMMSRFMKGIEVNEETMAVGLIDQVGPGGHFVSEDHTLRHFRDSWFPSLLDRNNYTAWQGQGGKTLGERASLRVRELLEEYEPEPLPHEIVGGLEGIVSRAG